MSQQLFYHEDNRRKLMQLDVLHITQNSDIIDFIQVNTLKTKAPSLKLKNLVIKREHTSAVSMLISNVESKSIWHENALLRLTTS